jgi:hypothetical protein
LDSFKKPPTKKKEKRRMSNLVLVSLVLNVVVLIPVCAALAFFGERKFVVDAWGRGASCYRRT